MNVDCFGLCSKGEEERLGGVGGWRGGVRETSRLPALPTGVQWSAETGSTGGRAGLRVRPESGFAHVEPEVSGDRHS